MNWRRALIWILASGLISPALAQRPPDRTPLDTSEMVVLSYDRSGMPGDLTLIAPKTVIGYSATDESLDYGRLHLTCRSSDSSINGRCATQGFPETGSGHTTVPLRFVERRSGLATEVAIEGWLERIDTTRECGTSGGGYWLAGQRPLTSTHAVPCGFNPLGGTGMALLLRSSEIEKLVAGRWDATLILDARVPNLTTTLATYTFTFDLTVTDHDKANIYFPASDNVTPLVNLNIGYYPVPSPPHIEGGTSLDMCLYDGLGSQIPYLEVKIRDEGREAPGRAAGMHSVWHHAGGGGDDSRLDYAITLDYGGVPIPMDNNVTRQLLGIDTTLLRLVVLPGMSQPVYCVPAPLTLNVPRELASSKRSGYYEGRMIIEMIVPSSTP